MPKAHNATFARRSVPAPLCIFALVQINSMAHAQKQLWVAQFGTSESEVAVAVASDGAGGAMVAGTTVGDLGAPSAGEADAFVARYDAQGTQLWIRQFGTSGYDIIRALSPDLDGGVYAAGTTEGNLGGPSAGDHDAFVARYDSAGNQLWIRQFGTPEFEEVWATAIDGDGGVVITGLTMGSLGGPNAGDVDGLLARYDRAGNQIWLRQFGTVGQDMSTALASDAAGGVFVAGFVPDGVSGGRSRSFLGHFDSAGNELWMRTFEDTNGNSAWALAPDGAKGVMIAGHTNDSFPGLPIGPEHLFLARYDSAGNRLWIRQFGLDDFGDDVRALVPDGYGGVIAAGNTLFALYAPYPPGIDAWIGRFDSNGNEIWLHPFGSIGDDAAYGLARDTSGNALVAGFTRGSFGSPNAGPTGTSDAFLASFDIDACYVDCDQSTGEGVLDVFDFLCFQRSFVNSEHYACDCTVTTGLGVCDVYDFLCFQNAFIAGCP